MKKASDGTIADSQLMLDANKAMLLGVTNNSQQMTQLMEVAAARGHAMGESTAQAFDDIVTGVGRLSPKILDNLGIVLDTQQVYAEYAQSLGTTSQALSEAQQKQALLNAVVKSSADLVKANAGAARDAAGDFEAYDTAVTNAKEALGQVFAPAAAAGANALTVYLDGQVKMLTNEVNALNAAYVATKNFATGTHELTTATMAAAEAEGKADAITKNLTFGMLNLGTAAENTGAKLLDMGIQGRAAMEQFNAAMSLSQGIASSIATAATQSGVTFGAHLGGDAGLNKQKQVTEELNHQRDIWHDMGYTDKNINDVLLPAYIQNLNQADQATFKVATSTAAISTGVDLAAQAFDDLKSKVQGILQGALDPGVGVDPAALLPRPDAINEDARRLADVAVNGWASPWAAYFQTEFPDLFKQMTQSSDIKAGAAQMLQDFQDGLEPQLLDKDKVKERVRRMLLGDENMAALAQEIASELSQEMGVPMQQALAAAQGTLGGGAGIGQETATQFADGAAAALDSVDGGGNFVSKFTDQMRASYPLLAQAGKDAGKMWGSAFLAVVGDSVPPQLISILTDLITPGVVSRLAQKGTLTGATP
jgi:hypothetical protein